MGTKIDDTVQQYFKVAESYSKATTDFKALICKVLDDYEDCRNELCLKCGQYKEAHKGACDGCRWK